MFPLNAEYSTKEINNRTAPGVPSGVTFAPGPNEKDNGSYEFYGALDSYIEIPNNAGEALDVRYSITILCWIYCDGRNGPIFNYSPGRKLGVHVWVKNGYLFVLFMTRDYSLTNPLLHRALAREWKFIGASYDRGSGEAKLWVDGAVVHQLNIGAGLELATQGRIKMGVRSGDGSHFKGRIAEMQVYNEALSQAQIQAIQGRTIGEKAIAQ